MHHIFADPRAQVRISEASLLEDEDLFRTDEDEVLDEYQPRDHRDLTSN